MHPMRPLLLALLVALLPLRGWVGDAMATGMLVQHIGMAQHAANRSDAAPAAHPEAHTATPVADCHGQAASAEQTDSAQHNCAACNLCHSASFAPVWTDWQPALAPAHRPSAGNRLYTSADTAARLKPPIS